VLGDDADARTLRDLLAAATVGTTGCVVELDRVTPVKRRLLAGGQPVARYDVAPPHPPRHSTQVAVADALSEAVGERPDAVLVADYGCGTLAPLVRERLAALRADIPLLVVDGRNPLGWGDVEPDVVTPNAEEAAALLGVAEPERDRPAWAAGQRNALVAACGGADVLLTLDVDGAVRLPADPTEPALRTRARPAVESRTCGAGDTFTAAYTAGLCAGVPPDAALGLAQAAADVVVERAETATCSTGALIDRLAAADRGGLLEHRDLLAVVAERRRRGHRVVFTNGCFDVLHRGHVAYLRQARALGDLLIVALNSDDSVARLKGPERPVNPLADRAGVVGALECVDLVTAFEQDSPAELIEMVRPEVYTKGGDYTKQMLPETPIVERLGGEVRVLDYLSDHSTTAIVTRIRATQGAGERA
jgi:D-beta-D-heptose 7-phosphate kinase/D-beta-D-heptose 1-phosphate adenosyltransferase